MSDNNPQAFFPSVQLTRRSSERGRTGIFAGLTAAAATAGVLIGFGSARGAPWKLINSDALIALGNEARFHDGFDATVTTVGLVVHLLSVVLWGLLFAIVTWRLRGWWLALAGLLFAGVVYVIDIVLLPSRIAPGFASVLSTTELAVVFLTLGLSLAAAVAITRDQSAVSGSANGFGDPSH
ncbi:MAG: hypothetical protein H0W30_06940 [Gemmatimonadaceae bacterium]|nr:hypothetical protein [Gemmatimonadaceae bacterium]